MMERGCYRQSYETLKSAMGVMKVAFLPTQGECSIDTVREVGTKVSASEHRLAQPCRSPCHVQVEVLADDAATAEVRASAAITPIRLESSMDDMDTDLISAVILLNFALSHVCLAASASPSTQQRLSAPAIKLLTLANAVLQAKSKEMDVRDEEADYLLMTKTVVIASIVLGSLYKVLVSASMTQSAKECIERLNELRSTLADVTAAETSVSVTPAAAAA